MQEESMGEFQGRLEETAEFCSMVGKDPQMQIIYKLVEDTAPTDTTVLVQGESGTGKELIARAIHTLSHRKDGPFVVINCSAYPAGLLESELFGHEKGAFTGAIRRKQGRFEQAHSGTVFLDEIGEISSSAQIKLLRVLQTRKLERVGGEQTLSVDVRVLAATNKDLFAQVKAGKFREDLYYRINVIPIHLPPLRKRQNDVPLLARHFLKRFSREQDKRIQDFSPDAMRSLLEYTWPGNVRELENAVEHATVLAKTDRIEITDLPVSQKPSGTLRAESSKTSPSGTWAEHESRLLQETLEACGWNKRKAAGILEISRNTLYVKLKKYGIQAPTPRGESETDKRVGSPSNPRHEISS
jgi:DNA-binding NtrC family response regulator